MKLFTHTLFFFLLVTQICFTQWTQVGLSDKSIKDIAVQNSNIFAVTSDSWKVYRSIDSGTNWTMIVDSNAVDVAISGTGKIFMVWDSLRISDPFDISPVCLLSSTDNGNTWIWSDIMEQLSDSIWRGNPKTISVSPEGNVFCGVWADRPDRISFHIIAISNDDGLVWTTPGMEVLGGKNFDFRNQFVITYGYYSGVGAGGEEINLSSDYGNTWTFLGGPPEGTALPRALCFFANDNIIIGQNYLWLSSDMCSTWIQISTLTTQVGLSWSGGSSEGMLIGTEDLGVFLFSDDGDSLGSHNDGLTNLNIHTLTIDDNNYVYAGTDNGVWRRPLSEIVTSVEEQQIEIPSSYNLSQNYPNPFNSATAIQYSIPQRGNVVLKVYDILGNEVATLVNEEKEQGVYTINFNANNLASGLYLYRLQAGSFIDTKKMILLK